MAMFLSLMLTLLELLSVGFIQGAPSIKLTSSVDVTSGGDVCPNIPVEFTCNATEVAFFSWLGNGMEIEDFNAADSTGMILKPPYTVFLDTVRSFLSNNIMLANFSTRLVVNLSDLMNGDNISCSQYPVGKSNIVSYTVIGPPPAPSDYIISFGETAVSTATMSFNFTWDSSFNSRHAISSYRVVPTNNGGSSMVECPSSCPPDVPCRCIGLRVGDQVTVNISAVNCGDQESPINIVTVASSCEAGDLGEEVDSVTDSRCATSSSISLTNGVGCYNSTATRSVATYQCDEGYLLSRDSQLTCQSNGSWNGTVPQCKVFITDANKGFLASSVVLWILSAVLTIVGPVTMAIRKVSFTWQHKVYIILLVIEVLILLTVIILWVVFGGAVRNPNRVARVLQNSTIIAAFALSLMAVIWIIAAVVFVHIKKIHDSSGEKEHETILDEDVHTRDPQPMKIEKDLSEAMYDKLSRNPKFEYYVQDTHPPEPEEYGQLELEDKTTAEA